jgi:hypothetical protein
MDIQVLDDNNPLYVGKTFRLEFRFSINYPIEPPEVVFLPASTPAPTPVSTPSRTSRILPTIQNLTAQAIPSYGSSSSASRAASANEASQQAGKEGVNKPDAWDGVPIHPHIYSNGIICLDLLDKAAWSPVHNVESVCISLQSMLTSNNKNERPPNDMEFCKTNSLRPRDIRFLFHDDGV